MEKRCYVYSLVKTMFVIRKKSYDWFTHETARINITEKKIIQILR